MIDLETLNVRTDSVILTIGAVVFDPDKDKIQDRLYIKPDVDQQIEMGRTIDDATINWWAQQNLQAQAEAFSVDDRLEFKETLEILHQFCWLADRVWSNGAAFDVAIIEQAMMSQGMNVPWNHYDVRDTRTIWEVAGVKLRDGGNVTSHRADDDAIKQALLVQRAYKIIRGAGLLTRNTLK